MNTQDSDILRKISTACRNAIYVVGIFSFFINLLMLTTAMYMLQVFDRVLASRSYDTLLYLTFAAIIALITLALLDIARSRVLVQVSYWLDNALSPAALRKCPDELINGHAYGSQSLRDINTVRQFVSGSGIYTVFDLPWVIIYLIAILYLSPWLFLLATVGAVILFGLAVINEYVTRRLLVEANVKAIMAQDYVDSSLRNSETIQAMGMMTNVMKHWQEKNSSVLQSQTVASNRAGALYAISKFFRLTLQILMLGLGAYLVIGYSLTGGGMIAGSILLARALAPVEQIIGVWKQMLAAKQAYHRLKRHFSLPVRQETDIKLPKSTGELDVKGVFYKLKNGRQVLSNLTFSIKPGEMIAIVGPSGAGKSTLARLLVGVLPATAGDIRLDGVNVFSWERQDFGRQVGYVPQDVELFTGTVKDNIARMGEVDDNAVIAAAKMAGVHELILKLPHGYDTKIGAQTFVLSGGERQRIALARAYYQMPTLVVLDEPNSNLDQTGEACLQEALLAAKKNGATQIIISHKSSIIKHVDRILLIMEGQMKMIGPRDKVLAEIERISKKVRQ